jgi:hypothetical protein
MEKGKNANPESPTAPIETAPNESDAFIEDARSKLTPSESATVARFAAGHEVESISGSEDPQIRAEHWARIKNRLQAEFTEALIARKEGRASSTNQPPHAILNALVSASRNYDSSRRAASRKEGFKIWQGQLDAARAKFDQSDKSSPDLARQAEFDHLSTRLALGAITSSERTRLAALKVELGL